MEITPAVESNPDVADTILSQLRGYSRRQPWIPDDVTYLVSILDRWDADCDGYEHQISTLQREIGEYRTTIARLEQENDELRQHTGMKGVMHYLKARSGLA